MSRVLFLNHLSVLSLAPAIFLFFRRPALLALTLVISACSNTPAKPGAVGFFTPYRFDRVQGNVVTREQLDVLHAGMSRNEVKDLLGTPLLASTFRTDRWDYAFTFSRQGQVPQSRHIAVYFKGDVLDRYEADDVPREDDFVASLRPKKVIDKLPPLEASPASLSAFVAPAKPLASMPVPLTNDYPPLESVRQ